MMNLSLAWIVLLLVNMAAVVLLALQPYYSSRAVLFGVYVPPEDRTHDAISRLKRRFCISVILFGVLVCVGAGILAWGTGSGPDRVAAGTIGVQLLTVIVVFLVCRQAALRLKMERNWQAPASDIRVVNLQFRGKSRTFSSAWYTVHAAVVAVSAISPAVMWDRIPATLVTHYDGHGIANGVSAKSFGSVFQLNIIQLLLIGIFLAIHASIRHSKQVLDPAKPEDSMNREVSFRKRNSVFLWAFSLLIIVFFSVIQGSILYGWSPGTIITMAVIFPVLLILSIAGFMIYLGRSGWGPQDNPAFLGDNVWKGGGMFYYNPADPALFVPKRIGLGWTVNFGRPAGWAIMIGTLAIPLIVIAVSFFLR